jgi:hypothetical protein
VHKHATAFACFLLGAGTAVVEGACSSSSGGPQQGWVYLRVGDCTGNNRSVGFSTGSAVPDPANCTQAENGLAAVCWDRVTHANFALSGEGCLYKTVTAPACTGGTDPGFLYVCHQP